MPIKKHGRGGGHGAFRPGEKKKRCRVFFSCLRPMVAPTRAVFSAHPVPGICGGGPRGLSGGKRGFWVFRSKIAPPIFLKTPFSSLYTS